MEPWAAEREGQWLTAGGWRATPSRSAAPVQVEGVLPGGELFYFRARHDEACLAIGGPDPAGRAPWERCRPHREAGLLPAADGLAMLRELYEEWQ
ncbi:hypothetical protein [Actinoplanes sp. NPDC051411]|uniref:hypothetical protein n=1 Tax=Actinoplanes sp. NPDC051411 TaxID=3155522 RepID=UPI003422CE77